MTPIFSQTFFNSANESNPEGELALNILVSNIIEIATAHANSLGIGNPSMQHLGAGWVLSRLSVEMTAYPPCNTEYKLFTWVESFNRHFSVRCFRVENMEGRVYGYARSVWMVLDMKKHENFGLSHLSLPEGMIPGIDCPIPQQAKHVEILPFGESKEGHSHSAIEATHADVSYTFKYNDIDFYRHVNTVRYLTLLLNQFTLQEFDANFVQRLELSFLREGSYGMTVSIRRSDSSFSVVDPSTSSPLIYARLLLSPRQ